MKNRLILYLAALAGLSSCKKDPAVVSPPPGELIQTEFTFSAIKPTNIITRSVETVALGDGLQMTVGQTPASRQGAVSDEDESIIRSVWVLQFDSGGHFIRREFVYAPTEVTASGDAERKFRVKVRLHVDPSCTVYFVANVPQADWTSQLVPGVTTWEDFKKLELSFGNEVENRVEETAMIPMTGVYNGAVPHVAAEDIPMYRMMARINFTLNYSQNLVNSRRLTLTSVQLLNVPTVGSYYNHAFDDPSWRFPDATDIGFPHSLTDYQAIIADPIPYASSYTWYVPENRRGENTSIAHQRLKWKGTDPSMEESGYPGGTMIVMGGYFYIQSVNRSIPTRATDPGGNPGRLPMGARPVFFHLHVGRDNIHDFNVIRNSVYNITATITAIEDEDKRVEYGPMVTYRYFYEGDDGYVFLGSTYNTALAEGDAIPKDAPIPNAMKDQIPVSGTFKDGAVAATPTTVARNDRDNIVDIFYDKSAGQGDGPFTIHYIGMFNGGIAEEHTKGPYDKNTEVGPFFTGYFELFQDLHSRYVLAGQTIIGESGYDYSGERGNFPITENITATFYFTIRTR